MTELEKYNEQDWGTLQYTITNPSLTTAQTLDLFSVAFGKVATVPPVVPFTNLYIQGGGNFSYNQFVNTMLGRVYHVGKIRLFAMSLNTFSGQTLNLNYTNTYGQSYSTPYALDELVDPEQYQGVLDLDFRNYKLLLDGYTIFQAVSIPANTFIKFELYMKVLNKSDMLKTNYRDMLQSDIAINDREQYKQLTFSR